MVRQRLEVLHDGGEMELVACAGEASQPHPLEAVMGLQVRKAHLDALSLVARLDEGLGSHQPARHDRGHLRGDREGFSAPGHVRAALRLERTDIAVALGGAIAKQCPAVVHGAGGVQQLAVGADVNVAPSVPTEVRRARRCRPSRSLLSQTGMCGVILRPTSQPRKRPVP